MNVLKAEFLSKQKRLQDKRKKTVKSFFSGYHTISSGAPSGRYFKLPTISRVPHQAKLSPKFPLSFSNIEESVEPKSFGTSAEATATENETSGRHCEHRGRRESTTSTSLEFQKLLEPLIGFRQEKLTDSGKIFPDFEDGMQTDSIFQDKDASTDDERNEQERTLPREFVNFNKKTFEQYSIFELPVPRNQRSIEEVLNLGGSTFREISEEVTPNRNTRIRHVGSSLNTN